MGLGLRVRLRLRLGLRLRLRLRLRVQPDDALELEAELELGYLVARDAGGVGGAYARGRAPRDARARHLHVFAGASFGRGCSGRVSLLTARCAQVWAQANAGGWSSNRLVTEIWLAARRGGAAGAADPIADPMAERPWARLPAALARLGAALARLGGALARLGAALARLRTPALNWLAGRLPPPVVTPAPPPPPAFCWGCALLGSLSAA